MIERLFFDRVDVGGDDPAVGVGDQPPLLVLPDPADPELLRRDAAEMGAQVAVDAPAFEQLMRTGLSIEG